MSVLPLLVGIGRRATDVGRYNSIHRTRYAQEGYFRQKSTSCARNFRLRKFPHGMAFSGIKGAITAPSSTSNSSEELLASRSIFEQVKVIHLSLLGALSRVSRSRTSEVEWPNRARGTGKIRVAFLASRYWLCSWSYIQRLSPP